MAIIYKICNTINNKIYIGETIRPIEKRWQQHLNKAKDFFIQGHLQLAMRKYGIENFYIEKIEDCKNQERFDREKYWIKYYDSFYNGYNSTLGGEGTQQYDYNLFFLLWNKGKTITEICEETGASDTTVQVALKTFGITYKDHINRIFATPVLQYNKDGKFIKKYDSANDAGRAMGKINGGNIIKCCKGEIKTSCGFIWKYETDNTSIEQLVFLKKKRTTGRPVLQYDLQNNFLAEYESCEEAGRQLNKSGNGINRCARGERKTAYGYKWKYKDN